MNMLLTACTVLSVSASIWSLHAYRVITNTLGGLASAESRIMAAVRHTQLERDRVTVLEREVDALRRELRKVAGKFYAAQSAAETDANAERYYSRTDIPSNVLPINAPVCDNWSRAILDGPRSEAASCECAYCVGMRTQRRAEKAAILASRDRKPVTGGE